ncbi:hypothetical protein FQB35_08700 [Crassaminicella thermophila]|uniref:Uncharacterized protein n=1 Tax=Crassaminicella thermophila TaxID=2599308 RepID=A0A5C0SHL4_CRATE|nr:hypothetical protein [Crassaminicella thermophila]QEK12449.1 hypothetical protein FQB35_08700 [Crassaminicella thermophila]
MDTFNQFVKYVQLDEEKRILISLQNQFESYLQDSKIKSMVKEAAKSILKDDFVQLEIGKNICRVTVKAGTEEKNLELVKSELVKGLEMAMAFLAQMHNIKNQ